MNLCRTNLFSLRFRHIIEGNPFGSLVMVRQEEGHHQTIVLWFCEDGDVDELGYAALGQEKFGAPHAIGTAIIGGCTF